MKEKERAWAEKIAGQLYRGWPGSWEALERENTELRSKVATLEGSAKSLSRSRYLEEDELGASELDER